MAAIGTPAQPPQLAPPLKWAGGKRWLVPLLLPYWERHARRRLVEPFVGGLAVALGLKPERALLNDTSAHLIFFYRWLQKGLDFEKLGVTFENKASVFARNRSRFNDLIATGKAETAEAAALFYYLNRTGYNGLCRFNNRGYFNVPFGRYKKIPYRKNLLDYRSVLRDYEFTTGDFEKLPIRKDDLIYADPPYDVEFTQYAPGGFSWHDQMRLVKWLGAHAGPVIASNQATTKRVCILYEKHGFKITILPAPRRISCDGNRDDALEMLATKGLT